LLRTIQKVARRLRQPFLCFERSRRLISRVLTYRYSPDQKLDLMIERLPLVRELAQSCRLCPHECKIDRIAGALGTCKIPYGPVVSSVNLHRGEEPPITGYQGSGTVFLTGCNLRCLFCQNFPISQLRHGTSLTPRELAIKMLDLQDRGAHNINFVTPTPQAAAIYEALIIAYQEGLDLPLVYNSGGYESLEMLKLWEGIIDIYLPDAKYSCDNQAIEISKAPGYVEANRSALLEMHRQVGVLQIDDDGVAQKGLLIRHLVLPNDLAGSEEILSFISQELSPHTYISLMSQYFPAHKAHHHAVLHRKLSREEYNRAVVLLERFGLENGWTQPYGGEDEPDEGGC